MSTIYKRERTLDELIEDALLEWHYYQQSVTENNRYNPSVGRKIDKQYFLDNLYKCHFSSAGCMHRFKSKEEMTAHRYKTHGA